MRLWSIHPGYLDAKGLVACWREGLLARKVLRGETKGYRMHPQLERFKRQTNPVGMIDAYLLGLYEEAKKRGYRFNREKIGLGDTKEKIEVTDGQLEYELRHLKEKLRVRNREQYEKIASVEVPELHPLFRVIRGKVETWEKVMPDEAG
jgi:hypothetical protein